MILQVLQGLQLLYNNRRLLNRSSGSQCACRNKEDVLKFTRAKIKVETVFKDPLERTFCDDEDEYNIQGEPRGDGFGTFDFKQGYKIFYNVLDISHDIHDKDMNIFLQYFWTMVPMLRVADLKCLYELLANDLKFRFECKWNRCTKFRKKLISRVIDYLYSFYDYEDYSHSLPEDSNKQNQPLAKLSDYIYLRQKSLAKLIPNKRNRFALAFRAPPKNKLKEAIENCQLPSMKACAAKMNREFKRRIFHQRNHSKSSSRTRQSPEKTSKESSASRVKNYLRDISTPFVNKSDKKSQNQVHFQDANVNMEPDQPKTRFLRKEDLDDPEIQKLVRATAAKYKEFGAREAIKTALAEIRVPDNQPKKKPKSKSESKSRIKRRDHERDERRSDKKKYPKFTEQFFQNPKERLQRVFDAPIPSKVKTPKKKAPEKTVVGRPPSGVSLEEIEKQVEKEEELPPVELDLEKLKRDEERYGLFTEIYEKGIFNFEGKDTLEQRMRDQQREFEEKEEMERNKHENKLLRNIFMDDQHNRERIPYPELLYFDHAKENEDTQKDGYRLIPIDHGTLKREEYWNSIDSVPRFFTEVKCNDPYFTVPEDDYRRKITQNETVEDYLTSNYITPPTEHRIEPPKPKVVKPKPKWIEMKEKLEKLREKDEKSKLSQTQSPKLNTNQLKQLRSFMQGPHSKAPASMNSKTHKYHHWEHGMTKDEWENSAANPRKVLKPKVQKPSVSSSDQSKNSQSKSSGRFNYQATDTVPKQDSAKTNAKFRDFLKNFRKEKKK
ncbi:unnamed protein product [Moneuplotes crassus]|uniref:Uncharacterized protein n=1 Tax=Euplotes crassus TaxID=5936 RepID=A0AAD1Y4T8_EUPCR|nr:unnamed protein product [Moneuplotes crassus]